MEVRRSETALWPLHWLFPRVQPLNVENLAEYVDKINREKRLFTNAAFGIIFLRAWE